MYSASPLDPRLYILLVLQITLQSLFGSGSKTLDPTPEYSCPTSAPTPDQYSLYRPDDVLQTCVFCIYVIMLIGSLFKHLYLTLIWR